MTAAKAVASATKKTSAQAVSKKVPSKKGSSSKAVKGAPVAHGVGRRKSSVARVWLRKNGRGVIMVNNRAYDDYFDTVNTRKSVKFPITIVPAASGYDVEVNVKGGGSTGQADATKLAIARALLAVNPDVRPLLREKGFLTVDSRVVERKKPGQRGARRKFQFVKR